MTILIVMTTATLAAVKARFSEYVDRVVREHDRLVVTRKGEPAAVLIAPDELEALEETVELLSDPAAREEIARAESEIAAGAVVDADELRRKYLHR